MFYFKNPRYTNCTTKKIWSVHLVGAILGVARFCWGNQVHAPTKRLVGAFGRCRSVHFLKKSRKCRRLRAPTSAPTKNCTNLSYSPSGIAPLLLRSLIHFFLFSTLTKTTKTGGRPARHGHAPIDNARRPIAKI
jgi:hypothetical protein